MIRRPPRSTLDRSSAASDVYKRQVQENISSLNVLKKLGMKFEKKFEAHGYQCEQYFLEGQMWQEHREKLIEKKFD